MPTLVCPFALAGLDNQRAGSMYYLFLGCPRDMAVLTDNILNTVHRLRLTLGIVSHPPLIYKRREKKGSIE